MSSIQEPYSRSVTALCSAKNLRRLEIPHIDFCWSPEVLDGEDRPGKYIAVVVNDFLPLLQSLRTAIRDSNVRTDILDVIKIHVSLESCVSRNKY